MRLIVLVAALTLRAMFAQQPGSRALPISTSVCEVLAHPAKYDGKYVRFTASFESDGIERSILTSEKCRQGIIPFPPSDTRAHPDVDALDFGRAGTSDKKVSPTFTGRFRWKAPKLILELDSVSDLRVTKADGK
jgi:hypothetical protein